MASDGGYMLKSQVFSGQSAAAAPKQAEAEVSPSAQAFVLLASPTGERDVRREALTLARAGIGENRSAGDL